MKRYLPIFFFLISLLLAIWLISILTINPITNYHQIKQIKAIMAKVKIYNETQSLTPLQLKYFWETIPFNEGQSKVIESTGLMVVKQRNQDYIAMISSGFDNTIVYNYSQDCWYSQHVKIVGLAICND